MLYVGPIQLDTYFYCSDGVLRVQCNIAGFVVYRGFCACGSGRTSRRADVLAASSVVVEVIPDIPDSVRCPYGVLTL